MSNERWRPRVTRVGVLWSWSVTSPNGKTVAGMTWTEWGAWKRMYRQIGIFVWCGS